MVAESLVVSRYKKFKTDVGSDGEHASSSSVICTMGISTKRCHLPYSIALVRLIYAYVLLEHGNMFLTESREQ